MGLGGIFILGLFFVLFWGWFFLFCFLFKTRNKTQRNLKFEKKNELSPPKKITNKKQQNKTKIQKTSQWF